MEKNKKKFFSIFVSVASYATFVVTLLLTKNASAATVLYYKYK